MWKVKMDKLNGCIFWLIQDDDLLEWWLMVLSNDDWYNTIWDKVSADIKKEFDSKTVYNKKYLKTKIKSHRDEATDFYDKIIPKTLVILV